MSERENHTQGQDSVENFLPKGVADAEREIAEEIWQADGKPIDVEGESTPNNLSEKRGDKVLALARRATSALVRYTDQLVLGSSLATWKGDENDSRSQRIDSGDSSVLAVQEESTTPTIHENESRALDELESVPDFDKADMSSIEAAQKVVEKNLNSRPMSHIGEQYRRITTLEKTVKKTDGLDDDLSLQAQASSQAKIQSILGDIRKAYGDDALWRYRNLLDKKADLATARQKLRE